MEELGGIGRVGKIWECPGKDVRPGDNCPGDAFTI